MVYFSGFCLKNEKFLFKDYLEEREFVVAGFSYGAQKALDYVLNSKKRVDKLQLISPAFFDYNKKIIDLNLNAFKKDKNRYIKNFLLKAGYYDKDLIANCDILDLNNLFTFDWEKIFKIKNVDIEIFLGEYDKIIALKKAYEFFKDVGEVYFLNKRNHFLRSEFGREP